MIKQTYTIVAFSLILLLASCGNADKKAVADNSPVISVTVSQVAANNNSPFLSVSGKIQATNSADLSTRMMGYVNKVHVNVGDQVRKGQLLVSINNSDLQAKRAQVNAGITEATAAFNDVLEQWQKYPEESRFWGINKRCFKGGRQPWKSDVLIL